jgi:hypothetical protein
LRFFSSNAALLRVHVPALELDKSLSRQLSQPGIERQWAVVEIGGELPHGVGHRFLHDIGTVEAGRKAMVHMKLHHAAQPRPLRLQQLPPRILIALDGQAHQRFQRRIVIGHHSISRLKVVLQARSESNSNSEN